jgi:hypothetical protein
MSTKKKDFKNRVDIDKLSEKLASKNLNFDINDFKKTLDKYSIPSIGNENNDVNDFLRDLKTKTQKRKKKAEIYLDGINPPDDIQKFTSSITSESKIFKPKPIRLSTPSPNPYQKQNTTLDDDCDDEEPRTRFKTKTQKRVKFNIESPKLKRKHEEPNNPRYNLDSLLETAKTITRNDATLDKNKNIIKPIPEKPEDKIRVIRVDAKLFGLNDDEEEQKKLEKGKERERERLEREREREREKLEREKKERDKRERELEKEKERERLEKEKQEKEIEKEREKERLRELRELKELLREKDKEREREKEKQLQLERAKERELEKERIRIEKEKLRERLRPKTKEELYQESLAIQIGLVEDKINQLEYLTQYLPPNHSSIIQLQVDIITEKKKLKEMLPANKKEKKGKITDLTKHDVDSFKHFYSKDKVEKEDKEDKEDECVIIDTKTKPKKEERKEERKEENINIFKYDRKIVEREYQERYQHLHNQNQVARNNRNNTTSTRYSSHSSTTPSIQKATTLSSLALIPRKTEQQNREYNNYCKYPIEEDDFPMPEKKVIVMESSNMTCEIPMVVDCDNITANAKFVELDEEIDGYSNQNRFSNKPNIENKKQILKPFDERKKTMINTKRYKKTPDTEPQSLINQNNNPNNNSNNNNPNINEKEKGEETEQQRPFRQKPIKLTQKREKDYLVNKKIINENKNIPENLMNFLYSSMLDNDYQINFIDILNQ